MHKDFRDTPPRMYLDNVATHCPKAIATYLALWDRKDKKNKIVIPKDELRIEFLTSVAKFRHDVLLLVKEGLLNLEETPKSLHIELVGYEDD